MKKIILNSLSCLCFVVLATGCSSDLNSDNPEQEQLVTEESPENASRPAYWDGVIGVYADGEYKFVVDPQALMNDLEDILTKQGHSTTLQSIEIVEKVAANNPSDRGHMLIASDNVSTSIGLMLTKTGQNITLTKKPETEALVSTTCTGCATGCNLEYLLIGGKRLAICNENGCTYYNCTKTESEFY